MKKYVNNEGGLTLIEILVAVMILSIVLVSFFSFFTQSAKFTQFNNKKLSAVQVAETVVSRIRPNQDPANFDDFNLKTGTSDTYTNTETYPSFTVDIQVSNGPTGLNLATIIVTSDSSSVQQSYEVNMYFEVEVDE